MTDQRFPGSEPLANQKHEKFCRGLVLGKTQTRAYIDAGYEPQEARCNASRLKSNESIKQRIEWLYYEQSLINEATHHRIIEEYRRIAFSNITDFLNFDNESIKFKSIDEIHPTLLSAIKGIKCKRLRQQNGDTKDESVEREITLHDKLKALERLEILTGMHSDINKIRIAMRAYGKDLYIDRETNNWSIIDLEELENYSQN